MTLLSGCTELIEGIASSSPSDPAESGGVTWIPDVAHPVFWGFQDLTTAANGTPSHLVTQDLMNGRAGCRLDLRWKVNNATGSRRIGS